MELNNVGNEVAGEASAAQVSVSGQESAQKSEVNFPCEICDFTSNWTNGLNIHMARIHSRMEQIDGNVTLSEVTEMDEKYLSIEHYLKAGWLGSAYQTFIDATDLIDEIELNEDEKHVEKEKILNARKLAIGPAFRGFPPWNTSSSNS